MEQKKTLQVCDRIGLSVRAVTEEGYLESLSNIARTGVQEYRAYELGLDADGIDPMKVIRLHRPAEEVFDPESMASFEGKPVTLGHPDEPVTSENWSGLAMGEVIKIRRAGDMLAGKVIIKARSAIDAVEAGTVELSNGYSFKLDMTAGRTSEGEEYDGIQREIRGNHVALVEAARCGSACRLGDALPVGAPVQPLGRDAFLARQLQAWQTDSQPVQGAALFEEKTDTREKPSGRAAFMDRQANGWKLPKETDDKAATPAAKAQQAAVWRSIRPDGGGV